MDLGCLDLGCIEKQISQSCVDSDTNPNDSLPSTSKPSKNKALKEANQPSPHALNRLTTQIKKPPRRKTSPLGWFPRKKVDSYLKRKIKFLQEAGGMNSTLDETLGDTNPHFSKVLREKIAVREAAHKAIEARKAALVEASWCRILRAARIESKEAEVLLVEAEKSAAEAFESAKEIGVVMYDIPDCPRKHYKIETSAVNGGESTTHTVTTSFDTAFEVDKQVAAAVKAAFVRLSSCPSIGKEEFKQLSRKISQNPDLDENYQDICGSSSECESDAGPDFESGSHKEDLIANNNGEMEFAKEKQRENLVDIMLQRLRCLQEEELASLATIVATCGLNAALAEAENSFPTSDVNGGCGSFGERTNEELPGLDKFLVKRLTRLEREIQDAKNASRNKETGDKVQIEEKVSMVGATNSFKETTGLDRVLVKHYSKLEKEIQETKKYAGEEIFYKDNKISKEAGVFPDLGSMLTKHTSKLEKEIEESKRKCGNQYEPMGKRSERLKQEMKEVPSLGEVLVKRVSRLEREVQEAKKEKENVDLNKERCKDIGMKEKEINPTLPPNNSTEALLHRDQNNDDNGVEGLDRVLVKHVSRLEKEKMACGSAKGEEVLKVKLKDRKSELELVEGSLDQILVKHKSRLEKEKVAAAAAQEPDNQMKHPLIAKREARERELQKAWGGMSFGNSVRPHLSRLQRDKAAWLKAEEEERRRATEETSQNHSAIKR